MSLRCLCKNISGAHIKINNFWTNKYSTIKTAGVLVIGDEILKGEVPDTNSTLIARELHNFGLKLQKITVVADDINDISEEVRYFSKKYDYVLTTGGIGPTHDDVTYEAVALAFDVPLVLHPDLEKICSKFFKTVDPMSPGMKQAYVPEQSVLNYATISGDKLTFPNVSVHNVFMFPGIPEFLKKIITEAGPLLFRSDKKFFTKYLYCNLPEYKIAKELEILVQEFPEVQFGCYPKICHSAYQVKVTIESCSNVSTTKAYLRLLQLLPKEYIVNESDI